MRAACAAPGRFFFPTSRRTRAWPTSPPSSCARAVCRPADGAGAAAGFAGIKLPLVEAERAMAVCETGDLIIGEVHAAAATSLSAASPIEGLCGNGCGCERRKAGTGGYILG